MLHAWRSATVRSSGMGGAELPELLGETGAGTLAKAAALGRRFFRGKSMKTVGFIGNLLGKIDENRGFCRDY